MNKTLTSMIALAAACTLQLSSATERQVLPVALEFRPASRSTLVASRDVNFLVAQEKRGGVLTMVLARERAGFPPQPVAQLVQQRQDAEVHVSVQRLSEPVSAPDPATDEVAALEHLYALVLRQEPEARYCLGGGPRQCDPARDGVSHGELLRALAAARDREAPRTRTATPWRVVDMSRAPAGTADADVVGVRATTYRVPLEGVAVHFNRAPHSLCVARTGPDGVASCRLEDQHGDGHLHDHAAAVVATFPGDVRPDRVLLPTTYVLPPSDVLPPPFAARIPTGLPGKR
jgi:hypothetical protein